MKILDVDLFQDGMQRNIIMLDRLSGEMEAIHHAVEGLVQMEEQLKGAGGNAIRFFYQECHLPFLNFFQLFSEKFKQVLHQMEAALHSLEPDSTGYIVEQFLDGELEQGLTLIGHLTASLTDEANSIVDQVSDIVGLPHLDDRGVQEGVIRSKRKRDDTLTQLYEFDATQTIALNPIEQDLQTMNTWLSDMEGLFQAGVKDINFLPSGWDVLSFRSEIKTELFPKVYLNPNDLWVKEHEQLIGTMITAATFQTLEGKKVPTIEENVAENIKYHEYDNGLLIKEYMVGQTVFYEVVPKVEYKEEAITVDKPKENKLLDSLQFALDIAGLIPVVGEVADGANGLIYTARGDLLNAGLSFSAMIPVVGMASTGGKFVVKGSNAIGDAQNARKAADNVIDGAKGTDNAKRPGGYLKGDVDEHGYLSPGVNRAPGNKNVASDNRIQSHHPIQNEWANRWAREGGFDYNEKKASAILLPSSSVQSHAIISSMQRKRRKTEGFNTDISYEFNESYREMIEAGVDPKTARKAMGDAYKYFDSLGGFVK